MMGGGGNQIVGYRYYMGVHAGLCRGPINEFVEIQVGERPAWTAYAGSGGVGPDGVRAVWNVTVSDLAPEPTGVGVFDAIIWAFSSIWTKPGEGYKPYSFDGGGWGSDAIWDAANGYWSWTAPGGKRIRVYVNTHDNPPSVDTSDPQVAIDAYRWINVNTTTNLARTWTGLGWALWTDGTADSGGTGGSDGLGGTGGSGGGVTPGGGGGVTGGGSGGIGNDPGGRYNIP